MYRRLAFAFSSLVGFRLFRGGGGVKEAALEDAARFGGQAPDPDLVEDPHELHVGLSEHLLQYYRPCMR